MNNNSQADFVWSDPIPSLEPLSERSKQIFNRETTITLHENIYAARDAVLKDPENAEAWIKYGRAFRRQNLYREAIDVFSHALCYNCMNPLLYRHRGHCYINCYCYTDAIADFEISLRLDPSNFDCWYHLGVAYFLIKEYEKAVINFKNAYRLGETDSDTVCTAYWYWMSLMFMGKRKEAQELLDQIPIGLKLTNCEQFYKVLLLYKGRIPLDELLKIKDNKTNPYIILKFGIVIFYFENGFHQKGIELLDHIIDVVSHDFRWPGFAYQAALIEKQKRLEMNELEGSE